MLTSELLLTKNTESRYVRPSSTTEQLLAARILKRPLVRGAVTRTSLLAAKNLAQYKPIAGSQITRFAVGDDRRLGIDAAGFVYRDSLQPTACGPCRLLQSATPRKRFSHLEYDHSQTPHLFCGTQIL